MTWWEYVQRHAEGAANAHIAAAVGITPSSVGRWSKGSIPDPAQVTAFARAYNRPVLEAFIAAGFLTPEEAGEKPSAPPSLATLDDDDLIAEVRRRMQGGQSDAGNAEAQKNDDGGGAGAAAQPSPTPDQSTPAKVTKLTPKHRRMLEDAQPVDQAAYDGEDNQGDRDE